MATRSLSILFLIGAFQAVAGAEPTIDVASQSRDAAAAFVATQNFVVGRIGRDCLGELGRSETAAEYRAQWQRENAKYYEASTKYIEARFEKIDDPVERGRVESGYYSSVNGTGDAAADQLLSKGKKKDVCESAIAMIDAGKMNIEAFVQATEQPIMEALTELVEWARVH